MTEMEKLAQWHDEESLRRRRLGIDGELHTAAAATIRAAMAEIERLREALTVVRRGRHNNGRPMCRSDVRDIAHAALKATDHE